MVLCQSPCAQPRAKKLRESFEFNNSVNHRGSPLQNDKTCFTTVRCAAGPMQHLQKTQVRVQNFGFLLLKVHVSNPAAFRHATAKSRFTKTHRENKTDTAQEASLLSTQFPPIMLEKFGARINAGSPAVSFHGVACCGSSSFSEVKGTERNECPHQHSFGIREQKLCHGEEEVRFSEKTGSFAPFSLSQKGQSRQTQGELARYSELIMRTNIF